MATVVVKGLTGDIIIASLYTTVNSRIVAAEQTDHQRATGRRTAIKI